MKNGLKKLWWILVSALAAWTPGMNMNVQRKLRPDALEIGGYLHQIVGRTFDSIQTDSITLAFIMGGMLWFTHRYLYRKPKRTGVGEYLLCGFFSVMQLLNAAVQQTGSVQTLGENTFQMIKAVLYLTGMFVIFLCALRGLAELLEWRPKQRAFALWNRHPFLFPFLVLVIAWLPHLIIKYPGALTIDTALQYHQYAGIDERTTPHPPFGALIYGFLISTGLKTGQMNLCYFVFTLCKTLVFIAVLAYTLQVMHRRATLQWMQLFALILFALSPIYVGWTTVISKDSAYLILCMLAGALMLENIGGESIDRSRWRMALLAADLILMMLVRHNGILIAVPLLLAMLIGLWRDRVERKRLIRFACYGCAVVLAALGVEEGIIQAMGYRRVSQDDWMALMYQQTGRVVTLHDDEIPQEEKEILNHMFVYDEIFERYDPPEADKMRWNYPEDGRVNGEIPAFPEDNGRSEEEVRDYVRVWWEQFKRYPLDYLDATLHMNGILFDLQNDWPVYVGLTDHALTDDVYPNSFNDMNYYNAEQIRPLNGLQRALTECYYRADDLSLVGRLFSMGFCVETMLALIYLSWVQHRRRMLLVLIPSAVCAISGLFCSIVYLRYLLPTVGMLPLWLAAWNLCEPADERYGLKEEIQ